MGLFKKKINKKMKTGKETEDSTCAHIKKKKNIRKKSEGLMGSSSSWRSSVDDPFSVLVGSTEGGFLSLEEIDEDLYNLGQKEGAQSEKTSSSSKKRKRVTEKIDDRSEKTSSSSKKPKRVTVKIDDRSESLLSQKDDSMQGLASNSAKKKKKKKKKKNKKKKKDTIESKEEDRDADNTHTGISGVPDDISAKDCEGDLPFDMEEISAWNELRLHPLLKRAIWALQFKEPTPIQKLCIPAAAHQGKDVIGAAETGSGKTLAFGLPILQRLLEEQEKAARKEGFVIKGQTFTGEERGGPLRALIVTPTRELALQVCDHLRAAAKFTNIRVVPIVGGLAPQKQERLLKKRPHVIVGTPGRLWELMAGGERHLVELQSLSFFVLDEADRMIEKGHFHELQSIIDMLPQVSDHSVEPQNSDGTQPPENVSGNEVKQCFKRKRRQTFVFSATIALTSGFRKKLSKGGLHKIKPGTMDGNDSLAALSERAGVRQNAAVVDLTSASIMAHNLEESVIECREEDKDMYLYYILKVHGCGRTIVFCTSIAALRRISAVLRILKVTAWPLHAQMQQRARLKAMDRFKENENCVLVATDVAARGLDIPGVRTVIHYQLPHSAEVYVHRSGRTARAATDGCSIALIAPNERSKYIALCRSFSKDGLQEFPVNTLYMPEVEKRLSIARQIDRISRKHSQSKAQNNWYTRNAEALEIDIENNERDREEPRTSKSTKAELFQAKQLQKELDQLLTCPLQPRSLSHRFVTGAGMSTLLQRQLQELTSNKAASDHKMSNGRRKHRLLVIGEEAIEPLMALRNSKNVV